MGARMKEIWEILKQSLESLPEWVRIPLTVLLVLVLIVGVARFAFGPERFDGGIDEVVAWLVNEPDGPVPPDPEPPVIPTPVSTPTGSVRICEDFETVDGEEEGRKCEPAWNQCGASPILDGRDKDANDPNDTIPRPQPYFIEFTGSACSATLWDHHPSTQISLPRVVTSNVVPSRPDTATNTAAMDPQYYQFECQCN